MNASRLKQEILKRSNIELSEDELSLASVKIEYYHNLLSDINSQLPESQRVSLLNYDHHIEPIYNHLSANEQKWSHFTDLYNVAFAVAIGVRCKAKA